MDQRQKIVRDVQLMNGLLKESRERIADLTKRPKLKRRIKVVCRYQQYEAVNLVVERVLAGHSVETWAERLLEVCAR